MEFESIQKRGIKMDFNFSDEQKMLRNSIRKFLNGECPRDFVREFDEKDQFPFELVKKFGIYDDLCSRRAWWNWRQYH